MAPTMTISDKEWTRESMYAGWREEEPTEVAAAAADCQYAYLILNTRRSLADRQMPGWTFDGVAGAFTGPATNWSNLLDNVLSLITESIDDTVDRLEEIRAEVAAEQTD
jgi:hypothetical protein